MSFNNTLNLASFRNTDGSTNGSALVRATSLIDGPVNRRTQRASADGRSLLSIAHTSTKENAGFDTQRSLVRLEEKFLHTASGKYVTAYWQSILSVPRDVVSANQCRRMAAELMNLIVYGENAGIGGGTIDFNAYSAYEIIGRLYAGEP